MESEDDIKRFAAFDELLRTEAHVPVDGANDPTHMQTIRLLHEVFRGVKPESVESSSDPQIPEHIGRFRIERLLGRGGFGTVYLADDPLLNRQVALKVIHQHLLLDPAMRRRALREREAMARLQHPNIIPVWEASEDRDQLFIISEFCPGQTLAEWLVEHPGPLDSKAAAQWVYALADAVAHSHQRGVIHRDLKPGNILLDPVTQVESDGSTVLNLEPRLSDFGLAKILRKTEANVVSLQTQAGLFVGSLEYASPEQVKAQSSAIGPPADIYALGVLLFRLLTGQLPHTSESQYELAQKICEVHASFPNQFIKSVPRDVQAITLRAMAKDAHDRYASADALQKDLGRYLNGQPVEARPVSFIEQVTRLARKRPAVTGLTSLCCLLAMLYVYSVIVNNYQLAKQSRELKVALQLANDERGEAQHQRQLAEDGQKALNKLLYRESIKLAFDQWQQQNFIGLYDSLQRMEGQHSPTMEWQFLKKQLGQTYHAFDLQDESVQALSWLASDHQLLTIGSSGQLRRWKLGQKVSLSQHPTAKGAHSLAIHPDGKTLALPEHLSSNSATASDKKASQVAFWNLHDSERNAVPLPNRYSSTVESLEYSPDGLWLAAGPRYSNVIVTEIEARDAFAIKSDRRNRQIVFSPESDRIAVNAAVGVIEIYELHSRALVATIRNQMGDIAGALYSMAWLPGHDALVVNARPERLQVYSARDGRRLADVPANIDAENIALSPDASRILLGDNQGFVRLFDVPALLSGAIDDVALTPNMRVLNGKITDMTFIDSKRFVAADSEGDMIQWTQPTEQPALTVDRLLKRIHWHDDQHLWAFGSDGNYLAMVEASSAGLNFETELPPHGEHEVARTQNAIHIASASMTGLVTITDSHTNKQVSTCQLPTGNSLQNHVPVVDVLLFSEDGKTLFATGESNSVSAIQVENGTITWSKNLTNTGDSLAEDPRRSNLYVGGGFEELWIFGTASGDVRDHHVAGNGSLCLLRDMVKSRLISGHRDGTLRARSLNEREPPSIQRLSTTGITALAMTADHRTLIAGDDYGVVRLADDELTPLGVLYRSRLRSPEVAALNWSPNRQRLAALVYSKEDNRSEIIVFDSGLAIDAQ